MTSLRQRAIDVAWPEGSYGNWPHPSIVVDRLIAAGLIREQSPIDKLVAWADAENHDIEIERFGWRYRQAQWRCDVAYLVYREWRPSIDAAAQYALDRIAEGGDS